MARLAQREWGDPESESVVFLHGLGFLGPRASDEPAAAWADHGFHVIAPDLPGFGGSPAVAPARVTALVLVDVGYQSAPPEPAPYEVLLAHERAENEELRFPNGGAFLAAARPHFSARITDAQLLASMRDDGGTLVPELTPEVYAGAMHGVQVEPPQAQLGAVLKADLPVLLLVAGQPPSDDRAAEVEAFEQAVPRAEVLRFPDAGHSVLIDAADKAIPAVAGWLGRWVP